MRRSGRSSTPAPGRPAMAEEGPAGAERPPPAVPSVTVVVTVLNDRRVVRTLQSLAGQLVPPLEVLVADGGSTDGTFESVEEWARRDPRVRPLRVPGTIAESRNGALREARGEFIAFVDADEVAPAGWLVELLRPFSDPAVGFTGGPTPGMPGTVVTLGARYYDGYLRRFYETVARDRPHALPMGNSAWRRKVFEEVGRLDTSLDPRASSEDQDFALRALRAGWQGRYVPGAAVWHDFTGLTLWSLLRKQAAYAKGGYVVWRRSGSTYEATGGRLLPYLIPPLLAVVGALLLLVLPSRPTWGEGALLVSALAFLALVGALAVQGWEEERRYPGLRLRPLEILRRWATTYGAFRGFLQYGWSGRRRLPRSPPSNT
jgi:cellulose synthase/poly-beta-1,6-N-acetylglucosamine synthase-like glycosyltransferase